MSDEKNTQIVGVPKETYPGERRVALTPPVVKAIVKSGAEVIVEKGVGDASGFLDASYVENGARVADTREELFNQSSVILQVRSLGANPVEGRDDLQRMKPDQVVIGFSEPLTELESVKALAERKVASLSMELIPRITRAQSMDALSSMATLAGYKAVILAAETLPKIFPMLMTAAGTIAPARVFVVGAGVAGLQAIASAKRLGAVVSAYDVRPAVKEQVQSLGAKFVELEIDASRSEDSGGYAKAMDEAFYRRQREMMAEVLAKSDVVITTAAVPGKKAPILITGDMVTKMGPGSVIIDLAAERGGNCELTRPGETVVEKGVTLLGPLNLPSTMPNHASQMYAKNISTFLFHLIREGRIDLDREDEIIQGTLVTRGGEVVHPSVRGLLGLETPSSKGE